MKPRPLHWRALFVVSGALILVGGPNHPGGTMAEMLAHPDWVWSHALMLAGFAALLAGLVLYRRGTALPPTTDRWAKWATIGATLQTLEMVFHTAAAVDAGAYAAGETAVVFTIHMAFTILFNPLFAALILGLIVVGARERTLGSWWIAWLGIGGAAAHGLAPILVAVLGLSQFRILFPMVTFLALWQVLAGLWPIRAGVRAGEPATVAAEAD